WVVADFYRAAGDWGSRPSIVYLHGTGRAGRRGLWIRRPASLLAAAGYNVLAIDLLHWGDRATGLLTTFTDEEQHARLYNDTAAYREWVARTVGDVRRSVDVLRDRYGLDERAVGLVGFSRGASVAPIAAAADPRIAAVVMLYGGHIDREETGHSASACNANYIGLIAPRPLLMVNGRADRRIPAAASVEPLFALAREPKRILWLDTGHQVPGREAWPAILAWLGDALP
ncbi:MAG: hypothetical protein GWM90_16525, partial [Gemmatimonadetes bacterium]|nr:hypothetical protein [Gemmatimonadota bacterium]NIQ55883.1 hypothetical protein [Gemmatimonadota bacterium]NIU76085.1 hypothetical protein [Gammaproteobacteria bacterium]NIX45643.1 hypothetical protein [Gemmatimonadota bacterium]NIY09936.1 hypothetical protein [Gemmatimonadota bacterium]